MTKDDFAMVVEKDPVTGEPKVTGTIEVAEGDDKVFVKNIQGEGTFVLELLGGHTPADDMAGNGTAAIVNSNIIYVDTVQPSFDSISVRSNNNVNTNPPTLPIIDSNTAIGAFAS